MTEDWYVGETRYRNGQLTRQSAAAVKQCGIKALDERFQLQKGLYVGTNR